jgi:4-hydroxy-tetrahydrodipicolinate synthase
VTSPCSSWESTSLQAFAAGATGWAPVVTNFLPREAMAFFRAAVHEDDNAKARTIWDKLFPICHYICAKSHIRVAHSGVDILGRPAGEPRRPLRMLDADDRSRLKALLEKAGAKSSEPARRR